MIMLINELKEKEGKLKGNELKKIVRNSNFIAVIKILPYC